MKRALCKLFFLLATSAPAFAQAEDPGYTLHVYTDRIQFAALILDKDAQPLEHLRREDIDLSLDSGKSFHPTDLRVEGDDPMELAVLLEDANSQTPFLNAFIEQFAALAPTLLKPQDSLRIFAVDCSVFETQPSFSNPTAAQINSLIGQLRHREGFHPANGKRDCHARLPLRDAELTIASWLQHQPGRRVLLVVSQGDDGRSKSDASTVRDFLATSGIAVVGVRDRVHFWMNNRGLPFSLQTLNAPHAYATDGMNDELDQLAAGTGGFVMASEPDVLGADISEIFRLLRARYIVSYPRPHRDVAGVHHIEIATRGGYTVRITGATAPLVTKEQLEDPNAVPSADSPAIYGKRKPLR
ncbi:hypothetical protein ACFQBQ_15050 [Granulicella cerasi]|uniref:VWFA-related domain-containing protein n=1 Tax=Granulicella cerasi TaxID=741063 RepID=A0ABW1ZBT3_9BACT|nr:hypothetical protein [Granulicella cerasi]